MPLDTISSPTMGLAATAYARLHSDFAAWGQAPSADQWAAIRDLLDHLEMAADGTLSRQVHISTLPCGTGKTQSLLAFARALLDDATRTHVGMLLLINRLDDIRDVAEKLGNAYRHKLHIATSDRCTNALGGCLLADNAQLVVTTHEALRRAIREQGDSPSFDRAQRYWFHGERRSVIAHDESFSFNRPEVIDADAVLELVKAMKAKGWTYAARRLKDWSSDVEDLPDGAHTEVPDFEEPSDMLVDFKALEAHVRGDDAKVSLVRALAAISGDVGLIKRSGTQATIVTYVRELPPSLMPIIVTDASARVSDRYRQMLLRTPRLIHWLKEAGKSYRNLTIRLVQTPASRSAYRSDDSFAGRDLLDVVARYVNQVPADKQVLVVGYKGRFWIKGVPLPNLPRNQTPTLRAALWERLMPADRGTLPGFDKPRVAWLEYGSHTSTNEFTDVEHVCLLGLNFVGEAVNYAATGAAQGIDLLRTPLDPGDVKAMAEGRLMDDTLQAILQGNARNSDHGDCGRCEVVVLQSNQRGLKAAQWHAMFPQANLVADRVLLPEKPLTGRLAELAALVDRRLAAGETELSNPSLYEAMTMAQGNFGKLVAKPEWKSFLDARGLRPEPLGGRVMGLRLKP